MNIQLVQIAGTVESEGEAELEQLLVYEMAIELVGQEIVATHRVKAVPFHRR